MLVIRIWREGADPELRARITQSTDISTKMSHAMAATTPDEITRLVREWLDEFAHAMTPR